MHFQYLLLVVIASISGTALARPVNSSGVLVPRAEADSMVIGYRRVSPGQAKEYTDAKRLKQSKPAAGQQIGDGTYITRGFSEWKGKKGDWDCVLSTKGAATASFMALKKLWVPKRMSWVKNQLVREAYIAQELGTTPLKEVLIFSEIDLEGYEGVMQMVIPKHVADTIVIDTQCFAEGKMPDELKSTPEWDSAKWAVKAWGVDPPPAANTGKAKARGVATSPKSRGIPAAMSKSNVGAKSPSKAATSSKRAGPVKNLSAMLSKLRPGKKSALPSKVQPVRKAVTLSKVRPVTRKAATPSRVRPVRKATISQKAAAPNRASARSPVVKKSK